MRIDYLANHPEFIPALAVWHHKEWAYLRPGDSVEARTERLRKACGRGEIPSVFIAFDGSTLLGSAMLIAHDMETRMELTPWLAGVFVAPERRGQGIGSMLVGRVVECAAGLGVERLYLYTPSAERMYSRLGWLVVERALYRGADVLVMQRDIEAEKIALRRENQE